MKINKKRLIENVKKLGAIGYEEGKGTQRLAYSHAFNEGRSFVKKLMDDAGLKTNVDPVGNLTGKIEGQKGHKTILIGSHIDTVPNGGIYDGAVGVLAGIELVQTLNESKYKNLHSIEVVAFTEEEGNVIGGTFGSKAFTGTLLEDEMIPKMKKYGLNVTDFNDARRDPNEFKCYLEMHVEQGGKLEAAQKDIGIVSGIAGILRYKATVTGKSNHAGSTPMEKRDDAVEKACRIIIDLMDMVRSTGDSMVCTTGLIDVFPSAINVIPCKVEFLIEMRDVSIDNIYSVIKHINKKWENKGLTLSKYITQRETICDDNLNIFVKKSADELGYSTLNLFSGAGHDLINTAQITPSTLIFIPSKGGVSHNPNEYTSDDAVAKGAELLYEIFKKIDNGKDDLNENKDY